MRIHQFVHTLNYGDAISGEALSMRRLLREAGFQSEIYSVHAHEKLKHIARPWGSFEEEAALAKSRGERTAVVLHYSIASPLNELFVASPNISGRALIYHNLTPVRWFTRYNARVTADLRKGRDELPSLLPCCDVVLADSTFNRDELKALGCLHAHVLSLPLDAGKWNVTANPGISRIMRGHGGKNILHVGRIAPNKCLEDTLKAFYFYHHKIEKKSRLWLIGSDIDTEIYSFELRRLVSELRIREAVAFVGTVSDEELRSFYEGADVYVCMSEHEGFCVPLLEAMHFGVPVVAFDSSAVSETLGDAGILLQKKTPAEIAETMHIVATDAAVREELIARGRLRAGSFAEDSFFSNLRSSLIEPLCSLGTTASSGSLGAPGLEQAVA